MINPWTNFPNQLPFVLNCDSVPVAAFNQKQGALYQLQLGYIPEPFIGNLDAPVVALNLNPGLDPRDLPYHCQNPWKQILIDNLTHQYSGFYYLDPVMTPLLGASWWNKKLKQLIQNTSLQRVNKGLLVIEQHGYHSSKYKSLNVCSQLYNFFLVMEALDRNAIIVIMRGKSEWYKKVPCLEHYAKTGNVLEMNSPQNTSFSPGNINGYSKIVAAL